MVVELVAQHGRDFHHGAVRIRASVETAGKTPTPLLLSSGRQDKSDDQNNGTGQAHIPFPFPTGDRGSDPFLSHDNPGLDHGPSGGYAPFGRDLLPSNLQSIPRAHNEDLTNERQHTAPESNSLYATSNGFPPDTNNHRPIHIQVRVWLE